MSVWLRGDRRGRIRRRSVFLEGAVARLARGMRQAKVAMRSG
jgi:hypothetical protein